MCVESIRLREIAQGWSVNGVGKQSKQAMNKRLNSALMCWLNLSTTWPHVCWWAIQTSLLWDHIQSMPKTVWVWICAIPLDFSFTANSLNPSLYG